MAFVPAPNIVQCEMRATRNGQQIENRIMVDALSVPDNAMLLDIATIAWEWWRDEYAAVLPSSINLREVVCTDMSSQNGGQVTYAPVTNIVGGITGGGLPNEVAVCVSLRTGVRGRSARGRLFTLGVAGSQMADENTINATADSLITTAVQALINAIAAKNYVPVIVSYRSNNAPRPGGPVYFVITSAVIVDRVVDSQKRRKPGVGQ